MYEQDGMYTYKCTFTHLKNTFTLNFSKKYQLYNYLDFDSKKYKEIVHSKNSRVLQHKNIFNAQQPTTMSEEKYFTHTCRYSK